jgi:hypothetical protein
MAGTAADLMGLGVDRSGHGIEAPLAS